ncbi:MAG: tetratricopeptide repeat protein [Myxococcales bacterium]|nr:tetratricopeptide repeat protein [Myxococcales bacterium]MCB9715133.1 tetratricopeptide repeat protein [Myxococcales bacterium]
MAGAGGRSAVAVGLVARVVLAGCAPAHESRPPEPAAAREPAPVEPSLDDQITRDIARNTWLLENGDEDDRLHARLGLAWAYERRAYQSFEKESAAGEGIDHDDPAARERFDAREQEIQGERDDFLERAVAEYREVLAASGPLALRLRAEARYGLAGLLEVQHRPVEAMALLEQLIRDDPEHPLATAARLTLGDRAFEEQRIDDARAAYRAVMEAGKPNERLYARYKLGWISLNTDDPQDALEQWTQVVLEGRVIPEGEVLARQAARDCVLAYLQVGRPEQAGVFFSRLHPELASALLQKLAQRYRDEGRPDDAAMVLGAPAGAFGR